MPTEVREKAESTDRYWYFFVDGITLAFVAGLMLWDSVSSRQIGLRLDNWKGNAAIGLAAGGLRVLLLDALVRLFPITVPDKGNDRLRRGSVLLWTITFLMGAFSEELWIAFCLVTLRITGHSTVISVALTAIIFGAVHFEYRFRAIITAIYGALSSLLFISLGSLIPMFLFHFIGNLGSLYWARRRVNHMRI